MTKVRGFEEVIDSKKQYGKVIDVYGQRKVMYPPVQLPVRADSRSAGYDFFSPIDVTILPKQKVVLWTNVKAYMQPDEVLEVYPRSSLGVKQGIMLANTVGIIDSSYYSNQQNDGNIGLALYNTSGTAVEIKRGDRIAQGIFKKYLVVDNDVTITEERQGGFGSSGK